MLLCSVLDTGWFELLFLSSSLDVMFVYVQLVLVFHNTDVASDWLSCFPVSVQKHLYDSFFLDGPVVEVVQVLVPFLHHVDKNSSVDANSVQTNVERCPKHTILFCLFHPFIF